ncbi:MAG TPA: hypothetical protein VMW35_09780 [Myxococcota bacterium]|jgi:hypothetical protein|nr:hypothetical protein [Myxococcota bacterium]
MSADPVEPAVGDWVSAVLAALRRARRDAEGTARRTGTDLVFVKDGKLVCVRPPPADDEPGDPEAR